VSAPAGKPDDRAAPTGLIVTCVVLALAACGFAVWAFVAQSDADDAQAELAARDQAAQAAPTPTPEPAPETTDGGDAELQQQIDAAEQRLEEAQAARDDAATAVDEARTEADAFRAKAELAASCLRGAFDSTSSAFESGGAEAAVAQLQQLEGDCRAALESE
jgi:hypothetical protein